MRGKGRDQHWSEVDHPLVNGEVSVPLRGKGRDQHWCDTYSEKYPLTVSVPLRGKGRDQPPYIFRQDSCDSPAVSVPLRGKGRDQLQKAKACGFRSLSFPSPCGEKVGINQMKTLRLTQEVIVSVPLRGKGRDQRTQPCGVTQQAPQFPSPCGEKVGINRDAVPAPESSQSSGFRPLAGKR